jgi:hypothetical protein
MRAAVLAMILSAFATVVAFAHHSFEAEYDASKPVTLKGTVTKVEWTNPHTWFYIDVQDGERKVNWAIEGGAPNVLYREGWKPTSLKAGDQVTITASRSRSRPNVGNATLVQLADGKCLFAGTSGPGGAATGNCTVGRR